MKSASKFVTPAGQKALTARFLNAFKDRTRQQQAALVGISRTTLIAYLSGERPLNTDAFLKLSQALGCGPWVFEPNFLFMKEMCHG